MLELDCGLAFDPASADDFFSLLPPRPAVCLIEPHDANAQPFLIRTQDLRRRLERLLGSLDPASKRLNLSAFAQGIRYRLTGSPFEQVLTYYLHAKTHFPGRYQKIMRLRPPAILKVNTKNTYPRCYATRRIMVDADGVPIAGSYYGPFASRKAARQFAESALDFFKVRRCQIRIRRDPSFPGCIYSEMKMCLAPCFAGCTVEEYAVEVQRLVQFLETGGSSLRSTLERERERASEDLDFEKASTLHKRIEKLDEALRGSPDVARKIQDLDAVILQCAAEDQTIISYGVRGGWLLEPLFLRFAEIASQPRSAEQILRGYLEAGGPPRIAGELSEHLWMLARWFYSNPRSGEIFFREKDWPYRRILRACSRLLAPKSAESANPG